MIQFKKKDGGKRSRSILFRAFDGNDGFNLRGELEGTYDFSDIFQSHKKYDALHHGLCTPYELIFFLTIIMRK